MEKIYFTVQEAHKILPKIKHILKKLVAAHLRLDVQEQMSIHYDDDFEEFAQSVREAKHHHNAHHEYFELLDQIASSGIFVKDPSIGLIDFYSKYEGRDIFLCYKYPEQKIEFWHELDAGFVGRQPVKLLPHNRG